MSKQTCKKCGQEIQEKKPLGTVKDINLLAEAIRVTRSGLYKAKLGEVPKLRFEQQVYGEEEYRAIQARNLRQLEQLFIELGETA